MQWAWKNYETLEDPEYVGLFHYRRAFTESQVLEALQHEVAFFEDVLSIMKKPSMLVQFRHCHAGLIPGVKELLDSLSSPQKEIF